MFEFGRRNAEGGIKRLRISEFGLRIVWAEDRGPKAEGGSQRADERFQVPGFSAAAGLNSS